MSVESPLTSRIPRGTRRGIRATLVVAIVIITSLVPSVAVTSSAVAEGTYYPVAGAGSTWSANALQQWIRNVFDNYRWMRMVTPGDAVSGRKAGRRVVWKPKMSFRGLCA